MQVCIYPSLDLRPRAAYPSRERYGGGDLFLIGDDIEWMLDHYFTTREEGNDWRASRSSPRRSRTCRPPSW